MMWNQLTLQDNASSQMYNITEFHDEAMLTLILIMMYVMIYMITTKLNNYSVSFPQHLHQLESAWTLMPGVILITLALPSLRLLYLLEEQTNPTFTIKITGHQWYWSYDYSEFSNLEFDSFMTPTSDLEMGELRLLEVDNRMVIPTTIETRLLLTAADVLHSWTIPAMGLKVDAIPGRLNQLVLSPDKSGVFYGQCSEICGANHSFMPISMEVISTNDWMKWAVSI